MRAIATLREVAERQHGLVHRRQSGLAGLDKLQRRRIRAAEGWEWATPNVLRLLGSAPTPHQAVLIAVLDVGLDAVLSHESAAALWGLPGFGLEPFHVTGRRDIDKIAARAVVHRPRLLLPEHRATYDRIPVTTPTRTLFDLAGTQHPGRLERALDTAISRRLTTPRTMRRALEQLAKRGRPGIRLMRDLLVVRPDDYVAPASNLEARFASLVTKAGLPPMARQVDVGNEHQWLGRVDFAWRQLRIIVEVDGDAFHKALVDSDADARRRDALEAAGWLVIRVDEFSVWHRPDEVIQRLRAAFWGRKGHAESDPFCPRTGV